MRKLLLLVALVLGAGVAEAQSNAVCSMGQGFVPEAFAYEAMEVSTTALSLTRATYAPAGSNPAMMAFITMDSNATGNLRYRIDGPVATSDDGHQLTPGSGLVICASSIPKFSIIRDGTDDEYIYVTYFRQPNQ